jgi:hypothetical protein
MGVPRLWKSAGIRRAKHHPHPPNWRALAELVGASQREQ